MADPVKVSVIVKTARDVADANTQCKRLPAYLTILRDYPASQWRRRHVETIHDDKTGVWWVTFEVGKLSADAAAGDAPKADTHPPSSPRA